MTPFTWTVVRAIDEEQSMIPGFYLVSGNICGRAYTNISLRFSVLPTFGIDIRRVIKINREVFGQMPDGMNIPVYPFSRLSLLGIPAVVGCGSATTRLKTGDKVIVDGGQGVVQILV